MPLVRDCSCRGDSAGFAHLSCLTTYAEQKCKRAGDRDHDAFTEPWETCNNCKQPFQNQLAIDLSSALVSLSEVTYGHEESSKWDKMKVMAALRVKIKALSERITDKANESIEVEITLLINQLLDIVKQTKKDINMSRWIHMPHDSEEYQYYRGLCNYEAFAYKALGGMFLRDSSEEGFKVMITNFKKARAIYNLVGMNDDFQQIDALILMLTSEGTLSTVTSSTNQQSASVAKSSMLQILKNDYEQSLNMQGINSDTTIHTGLHYAQQLRVANHFIEAERIAERLATASRQVHGPHHNTTIDADEFLKKCKERFVWVWPEEELFQALRYENGGEICVIKGPITEPRQVDGERVHRVESNHILPAERCPVICHGLVSASHLNGELGVARDVKTSGAGIRIAVHFEKKKSALVKPENLRIAFELPNEKE
jgi:hypothetical protein